MGSGSSSKQQSAPPPSQFLNPTMGVMANMFGVPIDVSRNQRGQPQGGFQITGGPQGGFSERIFGPSSFSNISDLTTMLNPFSAATPVLGGQAFQNAMQANQVAQESLLPAASEMLQTGFQTDTQPMIDAATRRFEQETIPSIGQRMVGMQEGVGGFSTDTMGQMTQAGRDLQTNLGALEFQAGESAADRRAAFMPFASQAVGAAGQQSAQSAMDLLGLGESFIGTSTLAGRQQDLLSQLMGFAPTGAIPRGNISTGSSSRVGVLK